jgi:hypothetical protein
MGKLVGYVPIHGEDGTTTWYGPDDDVPAAVAAKIGEHAWVDGKKPAGRASKSKDDGTQGGAPDGPPPMGGAGSGESEWRAYAEKLEVPLDDVTGRDAVVEAIKAAGHPVEKQ